MAKVITALTSAGGRDLAAQQDSTESQIVRRALATYDYLLKIVDEGAKISIEPKDGDPFFLSIPRVNN